MRQAEKRELIAVSIPATMRALRQTSLKGPQDIRLITDAPVPSPGQGEVLIRVAAAGVNFADISKAYGTFLDGPQPPYLAGFEAAGEVVAVGEAVTDPRPGTPVIGIGYGAFAGLMSELTALIRRRCPHAHSPDRLRLRRWPRGPHD